MNLSGEKKIIFKMIQNLRSHVTEGGVYLRNTLRIFENSFRRNNIHFESILGKKIQKQEVAEVKPMKDIKK